MRPAVFLDRDGTVSEEMGYVNHLDRLQVFPWSAPAIRRLNQAGLCSIVVTNQAGAARGYFPESLIKQVHARLHEELRRGGAQLDAIYYCPHHPEGKVQDLRQQCRCRKPGPGMLEQAAREHGLDLSSSYVVGDRYLDMELAFRTGARAVLVLSGYGKGEYQYSRETWARPPDHVAADLAAAVDWILASAPVR